MIGRIFSPLKSRSYFLFGPRGTGKSTYLKSKYTPKEVLYLDLLRLDLQEELMMNPERFDALIKNTKKNIIIIDEIQKIPNLLDRVHHFLSLKKYQFILTGSSARKLKQAGVNLLAGRASTYNLYPLSFTEIGKSFKLRRALEYGTLPEAYLSRDDDAKEYLKSYVYTYLEKEIQQEQWVRNIIPFRKFLIIAAQMNGKIINKSNIARDIGVDDMTIATYFDILDDTLIGLQIPAFDRSIRKSQRHAPKFYFMDTGVKRAIEKTLTIPLLPGTSAFGEAFEHFIILEIIKIADYKRLDWKFFYLRTKEDQEIDLVIECPNKTIICIEIKSKNKVTENDSKTLEKLGSEIANFGNKTMVKKYLVSRDKLKQNFATTVAIYWRELLSFKSDFWKRLE